MIDRYRQIFLSLSDAVFLESAEGVILEANTAASWLLGIPREQLIGRKMNEFIAQDSLERLIAQRAVLNTVERHQFDTQCRKADGSCINVILDISIVPELSTSGDVYLIAARTASKRDELERELRLQRQCAQGAAHASKRVTLFISSRNEISRYPPAAPSEPPSALDWTVALLHREPLKHELEQAWAGEEKTVGPAWFSPGEALGHDKPGTGALLHQRWLRIHIQPIRLRGAEVTDLCVSIADETELLLRDEAEGFTGRQTCSTLLSSAIFHEFNNYLGVILAQASGLRLTVSEGQLPPPGIGAIIDAAQKAAGLLRRTSDAAIEKSDTWQNLSVNDLLRECAPVLAHVATERISLTLEISPHLPDVSGVARLLKMMLLALGRHAISRLHATGQLALKTFEVPPPLAGLTPSAGISFSVSTGDGGAILALTDEPMEIALCKAILRLHGGHLETITTSTQGTIWEITVPGAPPQAQTLPAATAQRSKSGSRLPQIQPQAAPIPVQDAVASRPHGKILLADDEENFRLFTSWALRERGFEVITAQDGQEAFERFQEAPEEFALVILDAYMPRMGGLEAYLRMQVLRSDLPVLFASGFARGPSIDALVSGCPGPADVLLKPFSSEDLLEAVKKALRPRT